MARQIDIARAVGASLSTVSKALNARSDVSPDLRERILRTASELGYQTPRSRGPAGARSSLYSGEPATERRSASTSASVLKARSWNACVVSVMPFPQKS